MLHQCWGDKGCIAAVQVLADATQGYSGADLHNLCQEAALTAAREDLLAAELVARKHFEAALLHLQPSVQVPSLSHWKVQA